MTGSKPKLVIVDVELFPFKRQKVNQDLTICVSLSWPKQHVRLTGRAGERGRVTKKWLGGVVVLRVFSQVLMSRTRMRVCVCGGVGGGQKASEAEVLYGAGACNCNLHGQSVRQFVTALIYK